MTQEPKNPSTDDSLGIDSEELGLEELARLEFPEADHGYEKIYVDAFVRAISERLRQLLSDLEIAQERAERPFLSVGREIGELVQRAHELAERVKHEAKLEAMQLRQEAEAIKKAADREIERRRQESARQADELREEAQTEADALRRKMVDAKKLMEAEMTFSRRQAGNEIRKARQEAEERAKAIVSEARLEAESIVRDARRDLLGLEHS